MSQIMYNYPGMLATVGEMQGHNAGIRTIGEGLASEQGILAGAWTGDTGGSFQAWQTQWNSALEQLLTAHRADDRRPREQHHEHGRPRRGRRLKVGLSP